MELENKNILLVGLAKTGVSVVKCIDKLGANITVNDSKNKEELEEILVELKDHKINYIFGKAPENLGEFDLVIVSPGVPL
ncbi:MAG: UDP-N-acetylmuramoyl-L-alanine--D-glutamate ligase, partial [Clostridioides sp.]|nr:UDP-N-acetylmuramoyl-L-alanine--D-glutamate ligase [Clostridioides sp.]